LSNSRRRRRHRPIAAETRASPTLPEM
jgi:hypothetical protein